MSDQFRAGDRVAYDQDFLRSIAPVARRIFFRRGTVLWVDRTSPFYQIVRVHWDDGDENAALGCNLRKSRNQQHLKSTGREP